MGSGATIILAFSMSMDAFAAALGKGAGLHRPRLAEALRTGVIFGAVETITPVLGWMAGLSAAAWITRIDHWVAFVLLATIGGRMALQALRPPERKPAPARHSLGLLTLTAVATSLDAMVVGMTLAFINVNILTAATAIGMATFSMAFIGTIAGRWLGPPLGRAAELLGGFCLIGIGTKILIEHTLGA